MNKVDQTNMDEIVKTLTNAKPNELTTADTLLANINNKSSVTTTIANTSETASKATDEAHSDTNVQQATTDKVHSGTNVQHAATGGPTIDQEASGGPAIQPPEYDKSTEVNAAKVEAQPKSIDNLKAEIKATSMALAQHIEACERSIQV